DLFESGLDGLRVSIYDEKTVGKMASLPKDDRVVAWDMRAPIGMLENRAGSIQQHTNLFERDKQERVNKSCARPFQQIVINTHGEVVLCCADMYSDVIMGDTKTHRLEEIWHNDLFEQYRSTLTERGRDGLKMCDGCSYSGGPSPVFLPFSERPVRPTVEVG
ncbi:MAG TPA: SPASM domain-containing protein, partial [Trichormus sp.]